MFSGALRDTAIPCPQAVPHRRFQVYVKVKPETGVQWPETRGSEIQSYPQIQSLWYAWARRKSVSNKKERNEKHNKMDKHLI